MQCTATSGIGALHAPYRGERGQEKNSTDMKQRHQIATLFPIVELGIVVPGRIFPRGDCRSRAGGVLTDVDVPRLRPSDHEWQRT